MEQGRVVFSVREVALQPTWIHYLLSSELVDLVVALLDTGMVHLPLQMISSSSVHQFRGFRTLSSCVNTMQLKLTMC